MAFISEINKVRLVPSSKPLDEWDQRAHDLPALTKDKSSVDKWHSFICDFLDFKDGQGWENDYIWEGQGAPPEGYLLALSSIRLSAIKMNDSITDAYKKNKVRREIKDGIKSVAALGPV